MTETALNQLCGLREGFRQHPQGHLWRILRAYGIQQQIVLLIMIKSFYNNFTCKVGNSYHSFQEKTGVRQSFVMSAFLFNITIDWVMRRTTEDKTRGM